MIFELCVDSKTKPNRENRLLPSHCGEGNDIGNHLPTGKRQGILVARFAFRVFNGRTRNELNEVQPDKKAGMFQEISQKKKGYKPKLISMFKIDTLKKSLAPSRCC